MPEVLLVVAKYIEKPALDGSSCEIPVKFKAKVNWFGNTLLVCPAKSDRILRTLRDSDMPLRDHFRPPLNQQSSWEEVHGGWPMVIVQQLGKLLPSQYVAAPRVHLGSQAEIDVAAYDRGERRMGQDENSGGVATAVWAPAKPTSVIETEMADFDEYEVRIYDAQRGRQLVAAIEIISPGNKDRPESRRQFVAKCAELLRKHVSVVMVDLVTARDFNLYDEMLEWIGQKPQALNDIHQSIYAVSCCWRPHGLKRRLESWNHPLAVGSPLPTLPLWLSDDLAIPLDLEASYEQTCRDLRIA